MSKAIIVPDLAFASRKGRGYRALKGKLKYFQFRDDRDGHIPQEQGLERWHDRGLGLHYREILNQCNRLSTSSVLAWTWVISPDPTLMALVPEAERKALVTNLTEEIVEAYYTARGADVPEYSYVLHDRMTNDQSTPISQLHTHVVLPGTVPTVEGAREPFYNRANKGHLDLLRTISAQKLEAALDYHVGPTWRALRSDLDTPAAEPVDPVPDDIAPDQSELNRWFGPREIT